jgi:predicted Zn finger-like uncharacterized protein
MKITCHSCAAKYTVSDEKVQGKTVKMKCRKCGATIVVGGAASPGETAEAGPDDGAVDLPAGSYLVNVTEGDQRTMQLSEIIDAYNQGVVTGDTYVWADGMADWQALSENESIVAALNAAAQGGAPAAAPAYGGTNGTNGNHAYDQPQAGYGAPAPASYGDYGSPVAAASSHDSVRPAATAARKDAGRKSSDLFGGGGGGGYEAAGGFGAQAAISSPGNIGKRDENSVLFSLSALTATTGGPPSRPSAGATTATKEDSGLIDLKALAASAAPPPTAAPAVAPAIDTVGLFPLGAPVAAPAPAQMSMAGPASIAAPPQKRSALPLVLGGLVAVGAIVGVFFVVRGSGQTAPTATAAAAAAPAPTPTETAAAAAPSTTATAEASSDAVADASASASAAPVAAAPGKGWKGTGGKGTAGSKGTAAPPSTGAGGKATSAPPAGKGPCSHCGADLHCAMKCSAGKK